MKLHHEVLTAPGASPTRAVIFLHGILGSGANLRSHARAFIQARPELLAVLMDLRAHGRSLGVEGADTVAGAAADVGQTWSAPVHAVVGHSFGGKVALEFARTHPELTAVMTLDSAPGTRLDARGSETTVQVLTALEALTGAWPSREAFLAEVEGHGLSRPIGQWLGMNLESRPEGWVFRLSLPRIHALLEDYLQVDLWPVVERVAREQTGPRVHLVIGGKSSVYSPEERARAEALAGDLVTVDVLDAGHWVHVEDPRGLSEVLLRRLG